MIPVPERTSITDEMEERRWFYYSYRQVYRGTSAYGLSRSPDNRWFIDIWLPSGDKQRLFGVPDFEAGLRAQDFCAKHDTVVKIALYHLDQGEPDHMQKLRAEAIEAGELPKRRMKVTLELSATMRGSDEEIKNYLLMHVRSAMHVDAARITLMEGPEIREPRPAVTT